METDSFESPSERMAAPHHDTTNTKSTASESLTLGNMSIGWGVDVSTLIEPTCRPQRLDPATQNWKLVNSATTFYQVIDK